MATYIEQAKRIASGDWLARNPCHPDHIWQRKSGTETDWPGVLAAQRNPLKNPRPPGFHRNQFLTILF